MNLIKIEWDQNVYQTEDFVSAKCILTGNEVTLAGVPYERVTNDYVETMLLKMAQTFHS